MNGITDDKRQSGGKARAEAPLYVRLARSLKDDIVNGAHPVGAQLPTEDELCSRFSVSRYTVREALRLLREEGLVSSRQGAGTVVLPPPEPGSYVLHAASVNDLLAFASGTRFSIDTMAMAPLDAKLAAQVGIADDGDWLDVRGYRYGDDDVPLCWIEYYIHRDFASVSRLLQRHTGPVFPLIEDLFAVHIAEVQQEIAALAVPPQLAEPLKVEAGSSALEVRRVYTLKDGRVAQMTVNVHPASRFRHSMTLRRFES